MSIITIISAVCEKIKQDNRRRRRQHKINTIDRMMKMGSLMVLGDIKDNLIESIFWKVEDIKFICPQTKLLQWADWVEDNAKSAYTKGYAKDFRKWAKWFNKSP